MTTLATERQIPTNGTSHKYEHNSYAVCERWNVKNSNCQKVTEIDVDGEIFWFKLGAGKLHQNILYCFCSITSSAVLCLHRALWIEQVGSMTIFENNCKKITLLFTVFYT